MFVNVKWRRNIDWVLGTTIEQSSLSIVLKMVYCLSMSNKFSLMITNQERTTAPCQQIRNESSTTICTLVVDAGDTRCNVESWTNFKQFWYGCEGTQYFYLSIKMSPEGHQLCMKRDDHMIPLSRKSITIFGCWRTLGKAKPAPEFVDWFYCTI